MRDFVAAIPLAIALLGPLVTASPDIPSTRLRAVRPAAAAAVADLLTDDEEGWLDEHNPYRIPVTSNAVNETLVVRQGYTLAHNNVDLIADWVSFHLTKEYVNGTEARPGTSAFKPDPVLAAGRRAELADYRGWNNVYDRGHQCASADSKGRGTRVIRESFLLSNMTPQASRLNQNRWRLLEERIQKLADARGELWVITGPAFVDDDGDGVVEYFVIGENQVAVPTHYYKIVYAKKTVTDGSGVETEKVEAMAFLIPNQVIERDFEEYLASIDEIEKLTNIDFLEGLPDEEENELESVTAVAVWIP